VGGVNEAAAAQEGRQGGEERAEQVPVAAAEVAAAVGGVEVAHVAEAGAVVHLAAVGNTVTILLECKKLRPVCYFALLFITI